MKHTIFLTLFLFLFANSNIHSQELSTPEQDALAFELCQLYAIDQTIRTKEYSEVLRERIIEFDILNFDKFLSFVKKNGFPNRKQVGEKNWMQDCVRNVGFVYLSHNPDKVMKNYDLFKAEVDKGNLSPIIFSYALDRYYVMTEGRSYFDTPYKGWTTANGVCLHDKEKSDKLRSSIGLEPLPESAFIDCSGMELSDKPVYSNPINLEIPDL